MRALHLCFWLHHPYELLGEGKWDKGYFGGENEFKKLAKAEYQPLMAILERNAQRYPKMRVSLVVSGVWLEQAERWDMDLLQRMKRLVKNDNIELVITPYYYSMAAFYDLDELAEQVIKTQEKIGQLLDTQSTVLALPRLCYHNKFAKWAEEMGFQMMLAGDATETLDWRTANRLYEAKGCDGLRVLFWNRKLTEMITEAQNAATIQVEDEVKMDQLDPDQLEEKPRVRKTVSAADFVRGLTATESTKIENIAEKAVKYRTIFSAKKYQKQLDLELLRGGLVTLHLHPAVLSKWRSLGIVGFFDELLKIWSENPVNHLVGVREILRLAPKAEISIKRTVSDAGEAKRDYQSPDWWTEGEDGHSQQLYQMRGRVLGVNDRDLAVDFSGLTAMSYAMGGEQYDEILQDMEKRISSLAVESTEEAKQKHTDLAESTTVKVKFGEKSDTHRESTENTQRPPQPEVEEKDPYERFKETMANLAEAEGGAFWDPEDMDDMEAALQVFAQRMKWQSSELQMDLDKLAEAEVILDDDMGFVETDLQMDEELYEEPVQVHRASRPRAGSEYAMKEPAKVKVAEPEKAMPKKRKMKKIVID